MNTPDKNASALHRTELLIGPAALLRLMETRVILFGAGGVGSWCAEALVRSGIGSLTLVDPDTVCVTNINRQLQAVAGNIGQPKVTELKERLLAIRPDAAVTDIQTAYNLQTRESFRLAEYDYVIDAIDSLSHKVDLIASAMEAGVKLFSSMGAACKLDPSRIRVDSIWKSRGCRLARFVRKRLRKRKVHGDCLCVYSQEDSSFPAAEASREESSSPARVNGTVVHITGTFGFHLAGLVVQDVIQKTKAD